MKENYNLTKQNGYITCYEYDYKYDDSFEIEKWHIYFYDDIYYGDEAGTKTFVRGVIALKNDSFTYSRKINNKEVETLLEKSDKNIPDSVEEFLKEYKKSEDN